MGNLIPLCNLLKQKVILSLVKVRATNECLQNDKSLVVSITLIRIFPCLSACIKDLNDKHLTNQVMDWYEQRVGMKIKQVETSTCLLLNQISCA